MRSVRWKKYINCANRDKSTKLGTNVQHSILMKNFNGHTCQMSRDCWCQHFLTKNISIPKPIILYTIRKIIWCWTTFLLTPSYENVLNKSKWRVKFGKWRHHFWWFCMKILYFSKPNILYIIRTQILFWTTFLLTPSYENVLNESKCRLKL